MSLGDEEFKGYVQARLEDIVNTIIELKVLIEKYRNENIKQHNELAEKDATLDKVYRNMIEQVSAQRVRSKLLWGIMVVTFSGILALIIESFLR